MDPETWQNIYSLPHIILKCNKIKELQYKILYRYIGTNKLLYKINKSPSPRCSFCEMHSESIEHLFYECVVSKNLWLDIQAEWNSINVLKIYFNLKDIILGYNVHFGVSSIVSKTVNLIVLYGKSYIVRCKLANSQVNLQNFKSFIKEGFKFCHYEEDVSRLIDRMFFREN